MANTAQLPDGIEVLNTALNKGFAQRDAAIIAEASQDPIVGKLVAGLVARETNDMAGIVKNALRATDDTIQGRGSREAMPEDTIRLMDVKHIRDEAMRFTLAERTNEREHTNASLPNHVVDKTNALER